MPTYEYKCKKCGNTFEKFQSIIENPLTNCRTCDGEIYRLISKNGNFILKGNGFYSTDNRSNSNSGKVEKKSLTNSKKEEREEAEPAKNISSEAAPKKEKEISVK